MTAQGAHFGDSKTNVVPPHLYSKPPTGRDDVVRVCRLGRYFVICWLGQRMARKMNMCIIAVACAFALWLVLFRQVHMLPYAAAALQTHYQHHHACSMTAAQHPFDKIRCQIETAHQKAHAQQARQSKTVRQAVKAYRTRYKRAPPPRFEEWAEYALQHGSLVMDDYDQIEANLLPFRSVRGSVLRARMHNAMLSEHNLYMSTWHVSDGQIEMHFDPAFPHPDNHTPTRVTRQIVDPIADRLPDVTLLFNWDDRHRVTVPQHEHPSDTRTDTRRFGADEAWPFITSACPSKFVSTSDIQSERESVDMCNHVNETDYQRQHGMFGMGGVTYNATVPVLSLSKLSTYLDIIAPTWCYADKPFRLWDEKDNISFAKKARTIYWRGQSTGMTMFDKNWRYGHRQRLAINAKAWADGAGQPANDTTSAAATSLSHLPASTFDIQLTRIYGCDSRPNDPRCTEFAGMVSMAEYSPASKAFEAQFVLDVDGNSMSCRFARLLDSNSVVFKQTIWGEWFDDRMVPWLHYVPVSLSMEEVPVLLDYFINTPHGQRHAEMIAMQGKQWAATALRKVDLTIYYYRLFLEMAAIFDSD